MVTRTLLSRLRGVSLGAAGGPKHERRFAWMTWHETCVMVNVRQELERRHCRCACLVIEEWPWYLSHVYKQAESGGIHGTRPFMVGLALHVCKGWMQTRMQTSLYQSVVIALLVVRGVMVKSLTCLFLLSRTDNTRACLCVCASCSACMCPCMGKDWHYKSEHESAYNCKTCLLMCLPWLHPTKLLQGSTR